MEADKLDWHFLQMLSKQPHFFCNAVNKVEGLLTKLLFIHLSHLQHPLTYSPLLP